MLYDQCGHGKSSRSEPTRYTHAQWVEDLRGLAHARGFIALEFALRYLEVLSHLILVGISAGPIHLIGPDIHSDDDVKEFFRARWNRFFAGENKFWDVFDMLDFSANPFVAAFHRELKTYDMRDRVGKILTPTLLIVGEQDHYVSDMRWLAQAMSLA